MTAPESGEDGSGGIRVGCAGCSLPRALWPQFPAAGTHLMRYAARFPAVEINSSFYRPHRPDTWRRWAESVPAHFRFSVKLPRRITHELRLQAAAPLLEQFLSASGELGEKFGALLVQLPPSLDFDNAIARQFLEALRLQCQQPVVWEARHAGWFGSAATQLLEQFQIARVAADPAPVQAAAQPGAWPALAYFRLHGSPRMYYSAYPPQYLDALALELRRRRDAGQEVWCILDNTAEGAAQENALYLLERLRR